MRLPPWSRVRVALLGVLALAVASMLWTTQRQISSAPTQQMQTTELAHTTQQQRTAVSRPLRQRVSAPASVTQAGSDDTPLGVQSAPRAAASLVAAPPSSPPEPTPSAPWTFPPSALPPAPFSFTPAELESGFEVHYTPRPAAGSDGLKVVGVVSFRDSLWILQFFLRHHAPAFDSFVILDDDSEESGVIQEWVRVHAGQFKIELYLRKIVRPCWQELPDRNLLLTSARLLNATHVVSLDVDELLEWTALQPESRPPGSPYSSLFRHQLSFLADPNPLGWAADRVEMWNSPYTHRVKSLANPRSFLSEAPFVEALRPRDFKSFHSHAYFKEGQCSIHVIRVQAKCAEEEDRKRIAVWKSVREGTRLIHLRFLSRDQQWLKGALYELRGVHYAILDTVKTEGYASPKAAAADWGKWEKQWAGRGSGALGGAFRQGDNAVLIPLPVDDWLGPSFNASLPTLLLLKPQLLREVCRLRRELLGLKPDLESTWLFRSLKYLPSVDWGNSLCGDDMFGAEAQPEHGWPEITKLPFITR